MVYIALLRGINVGGKNMIKMADLKQLCESLGLTRVQTYIQSGNLLFESDQDEAALSKAIEREIARVFGLSIPVILRTAVELEHIAENCPFAAEEITQAESTAVGESLHVALLPDYPAEEGIERLKAYQSDDDNYLVTGREVYLLFHQSIRTSKLAVNLHKLGVPATVRNWKTITKLNELARAMSA